MIYHGQLRAQKATSRHQSNDAMMKTFDEGLQKLAWTRGRLCKRNGSLRSPHEHVCQMTWSKNVTCKQCHFIATIATPIKGAYSMHIKCMHIVLSALCNCGQILYALTDKDRQNVVNNACCIIISMAWHYMFGWQLFRSAD